MNKTVKRLLLNRQAVQTSAALWDFDLLTSTLWLSLHPRASRQSAITIDSGISLATDVSGNSSNPSQSTGAAQPTYQATGFNGFPAISFDGVDDHFLFSVPQKYNQAIIAVADTTSIGTDDRVFLNRAVGGTPGLYFGGGGSSYRPSIYVNSHAAVQSNGARRKALFFWQLAGNGTGFTRTNVDAQNLVSQANTGTVIGSWSTINSSFGSQQSQILLAELVILDNPSQDTINRAHGILAHRWWRLAGQPVPLAIDHPYYTSPPTR